MSFRRSIRLQPDERELLVDLYRRFNIPIDQYSRRPRELRDFVSAWNTLAERHDNAGELLHYMTTQRKQKLWITLGDAHLRQPYVDLPELLPEHWVAFDEVYKQIGKASDAYRYDTALAKHFAAAFQGITGIRLTASEVVILLVDRRKEGLLPRFENEPPPTDGFTDLDDAGSM